ncbi:MAG: heparinase II/III family protein [Clostridia bacterium]|nr:heparinase II/III family protein [Clostridia bacterium]
MSMSGLFPTERQNAMQVFTFPESGRAVTENPPCLCWIPPEGEHCYTVTVCNGQGKEVYRAQTDLNYHVPSCYFDAGEYTWNVGAEDEWRGEIAFSITADAVRIPRVSAKELYARVPDVHPRHLFFAEDLENLRIKKAAELEVLRRNIEQAYLDGMPEMPMYHRDPKTLPYREYFGRYRDYCDRNLVACALGYVLLGDEKAGKFAKELLLTVCDRNPAGPCSLLGPWGDEVGLSMARCLPSVYDLLYPLLSERERIYVADTVRAYGEQCYIRLKKRNYCQNPGDSHVGRLPAYLGEAALVLKGSGRQSEAEALTWLDYALEIYGGIFPYYGTPDGGWAEGVFYSTSYTKWFLPFFSAVERYGGTRFLDRPFYRNLTKFFLHFANPDFENHPFGDGYWCAPEDAEWPGFFAQSPCRFYADRFGPASAVERAKKQATPQLFRLHLLDIFLPAGEVNENCLADEAGDTALFPDAGFVAMHTDFAHTERDLAVLARASKFGSDSHRHADQGSFALFYGGTALISPSGYFGRAYGTRHHMWWLKTTRAHNAILVDGEGQESNSMSSRGKILYCTDDGRVRETKLDLSPAYKNLTRWERTLRLEGKVVTVIDEIDAEREVTVTYPLHTLSRPVAEENDVRVERNGISLRITPIEGGLKLQEITDRYAVDLNEGEPDEFHVTCPQQYHITYGTEKKASHRLTVTYTIE